MKQHKLKIAIVVNGRFDAFSLARELIKQGHKLKIFTNYPKWAVRRFKIKNDNVRSFWLNGALSRLAWFMHEKIGVPYPEAYLLKMFGRWASKEIKREKWDVIHCWSGVAEEIFRETSNSKIVKILMRASSHICTQSRLLEEEERRVKVKLERPSEWLVSREESEYRLANYIRVLAKFAYNSFIENGIKAQKMLLMPSAAQAEDFQSRNSIIENRCDRILSGKPLRILYVGALSFRKGLWDMMNIASGVKRNRFQICLVGPKSREANKFLKALRKYAKIVPKQNQRQLLKWYIWADIFIFPTIEDGYPQVVAQAQAAGLPVISTTNCHASDEIIEGKTGWIVPIRTPEAFVKRLMWCDLHRNELEKIVKYAYECFDLRNWAQTARDFIKNCTNSLQKKDSSVNEFKIF